MSRKRNKSKSEVKEVEKAVEEQPRPTPSPSVNSMDELSASEELPEIQENAIAAVQAQKESKINQAKENGFDPELHASNADGSPKVTAAGNFAKKRGRKSTLNTGAKSAKQEQADIEAEKIKLDNAKSAVQISVILETLQMKMISEEFKYSELERETNIEAWRDTFDYYGHIYLPPPLALAMDHMTIIAARAQKTQTKHKISLFKTWFKSKFSFKKKKGEKDALSDNRKNSKRKDDIREEKGA